MRLRHAAACAAVMAALVAGCGPDPAPVPVPVPVPVPLPPPADALRDQHYRAVYNVTMRECMKMAPAPRLTCERSAVDELLRHGQQP